MSYKISFDGVLTSELATFLQSIERQVNGFGLNAQTSEPAQSGTAPPPPPPTSPCRYGELCPTVVKGGHDYLILVLALVLALVAGAVAGYVAGLIAARRGVERGVNSDRDNT